MTDYPGKGGTVDIRERIAALESATPVGQTSLLFTQATPLAIWLITHAIDHPPNVAVYDSSNQRVEGDVEIVSATQIRLRFGGAMSGTATLT